MIVKGHGPWRNFEELEEALTLDELMLLSDTINQIDKDNYRMAAALQGHDIGDDDEEGYDPGGDELPEEILAQEREFKKKKAAYLAGELDDSDIAISPPDLSDGAFGYVKVPKQ